MPELPDITVYIDALSPRVVGSRLRSISVRSPFLVRTVDPPIEAAEGRLVRGVERIGKRIVLGLEGDLFIVVHLMIAGRLLWKQPGAKATGRIDLASFAFDAGTLIITEAGTKKRASVHVLAGRQALDAHDPGGLELLGPRACSPEEFAAALGAQNRTLKRALTDPRTFSGIGNAYSDEILHAARLSPVKRTHSLTTEETARLFEATRATLALWIDRLRADFGMATADGLATGGRFPGTGQITAFRDGFAVHGRAGKPCPVCGAPVQRIVSAENECNYCARCQNRGVVLADRSLSRLLKDDWPRRIEDWE